MYNVEAEEAVLGAMLIDPDAIVKVKSLLRIQDFYIERNGWIFAVMVSLIEDGESVDFVTVCDRLEQAGKLRETGGAAYITRLLNVTPTSIAVMDYAKIVRNLSIRRAVNRAAGLIAEAASSGDDLQDTLVTARAIIDAELYRAVGGDLKTYTADFILNHPWPEIVWAVPDILPTGLSVLAGRPKMGKSFLALQIAQAVGAGGMVFDRRVQAGPVLYLALEDSGGRIERRMRLQHWQPGLPVEFILPKQFESQLGYLNRGGGERLAARISEMRYRLVIIDTFSRAVIGDQMKIDEMNLAFAPIQLMAHDLNCAVMIIDHHRKPGMAANVVDDVMGSTAKAATADTILGLYRERGKRSAVLRVTGRDIEGVSLAVTMDWGGTYCWQSEGDADKIAKTLRFQEILDVLDNGVQLTNAAIADAVGQNSANTFKRVQILVARGEIRREIVGQKVLYRRVT